MSNDRASSDMTPPPLCHLDFEVVKDLPPELFSELNEIYGGKLNDFVTKGKGISESTSSLGDSFSRQEGEILFLHFYSY